MEIWLIWLTAGAVMMLLETIIPGGVIVFLGLSALVVALTVYMGWVTSIPMAFMTWFIVSIFMMIFLRSLFIKYFEGDSVVQNVNEDEDLIGSVVKIVEEVKPFKEGRVKFRDTTWMARSEEELLEGASARICGRDGNILLVKSI